MANLNIIEKINPSEYFLLKREISMCPSLYKSLYELTDISFSEQVPTAAVTFDKKGNMLNMIINQDFWESLPFEGKRFVILHELSHIIYKHGLRSILLDLDFKLSNIAQDIFINHHLHNNYGINRDLFKWEQYCWTETCFPGENVPNNQSFEYYYAKLKNQQQNLDHLKLLGSHGESLEKTDTKSLPSETEENDDEDNDEVPSLEDIIENNPEISQDCQDFFKNDSNKIQKKVILDRKPQEIEGSTSKGVNRDIQRIENNLSEYDKFIKELIPIKKKGQERTKSHDAWNQISRRYMDFLSTNNHFFLPATVENVLPDKPKKKSVWVFTDTSGSCHGMVPIFANIIQDLAEHPLISDCRAFCFGDTCVEIPIKKNNKGSLNIRYQSGNDGGLSCIERKIKQIMEDENIPHPDNVVVISDGELTFREKNNVTKPEAWYLLISVKSNIPSILPPGAKSKVFNEHTFMSNNSNHSNSKRRP